MKPRKTRSTDQLPDCWEKCLDQCHGNNECLQNLVDSCKADCNKKSVAIEIANDNVNHNGFANPH